MMQNLETEKTDFRVWSDVFEFIQGGKSPDSENKKYESAETRETLF